ncbi:MULTISPECIES: PTS sugar transporter subunit IIA [unclassified Gilliamella]|uniref:PTS sugar transporter subunit IIA n=1 Tax=unclassified Gilliamella TaxID=2685620 RepID=UPI002269FC15|nr:MULTISPECIES: PTS sugar transporter subunit IIA [unclassified Gilliamella]MCX8600387.1 PTS sugar transporter subunit IIA [Gilliamella sp. B3722]MCX8609383.1 PTS sugar transporter subunit IIA [Gilliamella sp. B3771]MCX8609602.1 PTS sugar transporter subunit IIA [Gilliamella sp. B3891]MCX8612309.1 PTS sugar transporter subunit IIA [Gilliamella sp. B3773]MCX8615729.1 PTS sugar transporter subunit IIA [Gilliamella sp. B3770]
MSNLKLTPEDIAIIEGAYSKQQAIELVSNNMIQAGFVAQDYTQAMLDRDSQISTFLGNGIAIPHGTTEKRDSVLKTGLKVIYFPQGINWDEDNNTAYVVIGIAAKANEHLDILRQLTRAVIAEDTLERIKRVKTPDDLLAIIQGN